MPSGKVVAAMSGGVDSCVAAALLKGFGYDVVGITMKLWPNEECGESADKACCSLGGIRDARYACGVIGIPHYVISMYPRFKKGVIDYFASAYAGGLTPNPCVLCNEKIKFGSLVKKALELNASHVATGHFAILRYDNRVKRYVLRSGVDAKKDQSYFLFSLNQDQLAHSLFPNGGYTKSQIRKMAMNMKLELLHDKKSSQDICFAKGKYAEFLKKKIKMDVTPGDIVDISGSVIGRHKGIPFYTIGQREGLGISHKEPLYVTSIDATANRLTVGPRMELYKKTLIADKINWVSIKSPKLKIRAQAKIRYSHNKAPADIQIVSSDTAKIFFDEPQMAPTPGQAVVFYNSDIVLGGGWIKEAMN